MKKQITIPRGYDPADADIGSYNLVSGTYNYEFWYAEIGDVKTVLGETNYNLGLLCNSTSINQWAAYKPNRYGSPDDDWEYTGMAVSSKEITYEKPTNVSGYWLGHFLGYNHNATEPKINVAADYYYTYDGVEEEKGTDETMIVTLPEFDIRTGVRNGQITHWTTKVTCKLTSGNKTTETHGEITNDEIEVKSLSTTFKIYKTDDASYEIDIEVWFGTTTDYEIFKHPDSPKTTDATKQTDYQLTVISQDMDYQANYSSAIIDNTTGEFSYDLTITDDGSNQRGGTATENVYISGVLTEVGTANFSATSTIPNSDDLPAGYTLPLENDVVIILTDFSVDPL